MATQGPDVTDDGVVSPLDVFIVLDNISNDLPYDPSLDVNGDGKITPEDALEIINELNKPPVDPNPPSPDPPPPPLL